MGSVKTPSKTLGRLFGPVAENPKGGLGVYFFDFFAEKLAKKSIPEVQKGAKIVSKDANYNMCKMGGITKKDQKSHFGAFSLFQGRIFLNL